MISKILWGLGMAVLFWIILIVASSIAIADHLFNGDAGFTKAKYPNRQSITVADRSGLAIDVAAVIAPWNQLAGWALFAPCAFRYGCAQTDVVWVADSSTWVELQPSPTEPYTRCAIHSATRDTRTQQHEIGHCIGFGDHIWASMWGTPGYVNPRVCDDPNHPAYSPYRGVMSYCNWGGAYWWGPDDTTMLERAGYRQVAATPTPTLTPRPRR